MSTVASLTLGSIFSGSLYTPVPQAEPDTPLPPSDNEQGGGGPINAGTDNAAINNNASITITAATTEREQQQLPRELRRVIIELWNLIPFMALFIAVFFRYHFFGIVVFGWNRLILFSLDASLKKQVSLKDGRFAVSILSQVMTALFQILTTYTLMVHPEAISYFYFSYVPADRSFWNILFLTTMNDTTICYCAILLKSIIVLCPCTCRGSLSISVQHRYKRQLYSFVELASIFYRSLVTIPLWIVFYRSLETEDGAYFSNVLESLYLISKSIVCFNHFREMALIASKICGDELSFGQRATAEEMAELGVRECTICYDSVTKPVKLSCNHIFCEDCVIEWLEREQTCPLCRLNIRGTGNLLYGDGSTSCYLVL